jgi:hypothetical protein
VAERVGFEPTNTREDVTGIPVQRLRPLGHLSNQLLAKTFSTASSSAWPAAPPRKGANDTPSRLRKCLLWGVEGGRRVEARIGLFSRRRGGCIQSRDVQRIGRVGIVQPGRDLQRGNAGRPHIRLGVVARTTQGSQVLATRETYEGSHNSDQRKATPHLFTTFSRPAAGVQREKSTQYASGAQRSQHSRLMFRGQLSERQAYTALYHSHSRQGPLCGNRIRLEKQVTM